MGEYPRGLRGYDGNTQKWGGGSNPPSPTLLSLYRNVPHGLTLTFKLYVATFVDKYIPIKIYQFRFSPPIRMLDALQVGSGLSSNNLKESIMEHIELFFKMLFSMGIMIFVFTVILDCLLGKNK